MKNVFLFFLLFISLGLLAQQQQTIEFKDFKIHLTTFGKGKPLLIINGGPGMKSEGFASLAKELGKNNLAILYDQRGTGQSTIDVISPKTITMDLMVADIETIRKYLKIDNWAVLGHSFGGMLASYYVSKHPSNVKGLILSSSGGVDLALRSTLNLTSRLTQKERDSLNYWAQEIRNGDTSHYTALQRGKNLAPVYVYNKKFVPIVAERLTQGNVDINRLVWQNMIDMRFDCKNGLKTFKNPVLIIHGNQDVLNKEIAETADRVFSNSELFYIDKCAHYGWLDQPDVYYGKIRHFLSSLN